MRIVIVGAGAVGSYLAERLSADGKDVVVIDIDPARTARLQERIDALVLTGNGAAVSMLEAAGVGQADLLIAASGSDGTNVLACHTAGALGVPTTIARIEDDGIKEVAARLGVSYVIDPSAAAAEALAHLVGAGGASEVIPFSGGRLVMVGGQVTDGSPLTRGPLRLLRLRYPEWGWVVAAVVRSGGTEVAHGDTRLEAGDHALLMTTADRVEDTGALIGLHKRRLTRAIVVGATRFAGLTAERLHQARLEVVLIESEPERAAGLAADHAGIMVIEGDPTDPDVYSELDVGGSDVVIALTGWDEVNVLSCLVAKAKGAGMVISRFYRTENVKLLGGVGIDAAISSRLTAASEILRFVHSGFVEQVATFSDTDAEAIDIEVQEGAAAVGQSLAELGLPTGVIVGGISRNETTFVPDGSSVIKAGDHIVFFALPQDIAASESLFVDDRSS